VVIIASIVPSTQRCVAPIRAEKLGLDRDNLLGKFIALARVA
jgi:hypothetical protein